METRRREKGGPGGLGPFLDAFVCSLVPMATPVTIKVISRMLLVFVLGDLCRAKEGSFLVCVQQTHV